MLTWAKVWKCEHLDCLYRWIAADPLKPPLKCARCKRRGWHTGKDYTAEPAGGPGPPAAELEPLPPPVAPPSSLDAIKARLGLQPAADLVAPPGAGLPADPPKVRRDFNPGRRSWYASLPSGCDWAELLRDRDTGQVWLVANGAATEYPTEEDARRDLDA